MAGCTRDVAIPATTPTGSQTAWCDKVMAALPQTLSGQQRRTVSSDTPYVAAWGEQPITLRCGADPASPGPNTNPAVVQGRSWAVELRTKGAIATSTDTPAPVQVGIPSAFQPPELVLAGLDSALTAAGS